jgi:hypothetical protein
MSIQGANRSEHQNEKHWTENLSKLVPMYLMQEASAHRDFKLVDFSRLFGQMMNGLLNTAN